MHTSTCPVFQIKSKTPELIAVTSANSSLSYGQLNSLINTIATNLLSYNLRRETRVAILAKNSPEMLATIFACQRIGLSTCLLNLQLSKKDWENQITQGECNLLIGDSNILKEHSISLIPTTCMSEITKVTQNKAEVPTLLETNKEAVVIFTSGSTGHNKGVRLSVGNLLSSAEASNRLTKLSPGDSWGVSLPMYHLGGLGIVYRTLSSGATALFLPDFSPNSIYSLLKTGELTHLSVVPTTLSALIDLAKNNPMEGDKLLGSLKCAILAGAASSEILLKEIISHNLPILSAWGMTETTAHCTCMSLDEPKENIGSVGKPFYHTQLKIVDDHAKEVAPQLTGEILIKGPTVFMGYIDKDQTDSYVKDEWLHSGDLGCYDKNGNLKIVGRKDDMIISGGENIHTGEIEKVAKTLSSINDCAVIPVAHSKWGQRPIIIVEPKEHLSLSKEIVLEHLKENLAKIKVPDDVIIRTTLPRTSIGKVDYKKLKAEFN